MTEEIWKGLADGTYNDKKYLGVPDMTPEEKALVLGIFEDGSFDWNVDDKDLMEGANSGFLSPSTVHIDPMDGTNY
jgi:hypothetical protein